MIAGAGDDIITDTQSIYSSGQEDDVYNGGAGIDTFIHDLNWVSSVTFDLTAGFTTFGGNRDQLISIENLIVGGNAQVRGSSVANVLTVNGTGANIIDGEAGNDTINAGGGNDTINAGLGNDLVDGGGGNDTVFDTDGTTSDQYDGGADSDTLDYSGILFVPGVVFDAAAGTVGNAPGTWDTFTNFEAIIASQGHDILVGGGLVSSS